MSSEKCNNIHAIIFCCLQNYADKIALSKQTFLTRWIGYHGTQQVKELKLIKHYQQQFETALHHVNTGENQTTAEKIYITTVNTLLVNLTTKATAIEPNSFLVKQLHKIKVNIEAIHHVAEVMMQRSDKVA